MTCHASRCFTGFRLLYSPVKVACALWARSMSSRQIDFHVEETARAVRRAPRAVGQVQQPM